MGLMIRQDQGQTVTQDWPGQHIPLCLLVKLYQFLAHQTNSSCNKAVLKIHHELCVILKKPCSENDVRFRVPNCMSLFGLQSVPAGEQCRGPQCLAAEGDSDFSQVFLKHSEQCGTTPGATLGPSSRSMGTDVGCLQLAHQRNPIARGIWHVGTWKRSKGAELQICEILAAGGCTAKIN
uniref:Uncharacterized protein n=1 Tax=Dromaius novaehollandiae TaxID=8790 RepID=A0A8C4KUL4_DRONO